MNPAVNTVSHPGTAPRSRGKTGARTGAPWQGRSRAAPSRTQPRHRPRSCLRPPGAAARRRRWSGRSSAEIATLPRASPSRKLEPLRPAATPARSSPDRPEQEVCPGHIGHGGPGSQEPQGQPDDQVPRVLLQMPMSMRRQAHEHESERDGATQHAHLDGLSTVSTGKGDARRERGDQGCRGRTARARCPMRYRRIRGRP